MLAEAATLLEDAAFDHLLAVTTDGCLVGILCNKLLRDFELTMGLYNQNLQRDGYSVLVGDMMTRDPITICPHHKLFQAANTMLEHKVSSLVVTEEQQIKGILSYTDILQSLTTFAAYCNHCTDKRTLSFNN